MSKVFMDLEMNKVRHSLSQVISIGAVKVEKDILDEFYSLCALTEDEDIPWDITMLTGIDEDKLFYAPTFMEALRKFVDFWDGDVIYVWGDYDKGCLNYSYRKYVQKYKDIDNNKITVSRKELRELMSKIVNIQDAIHDRLNEDYLLSLGNIADKYKILKDEDTLHNALSDAKVLYKLNQLSYQIYNSNKCQK